MSADNVGVDRASSDRGSINEQRPLIGLTTAATSSRARSKIAALNTQLGDWGREFRRTYGSTRSNRCAFDDEHVQVYYTVFKPPETDFCTDIAANYVPQVATGESVFQNTVSHAKQAIARKVFPKRISKGSSGSYFVYDENKTVLGVFKPKDEEPYGPLSPKWTKWLHRNLFPCFFGRSCLIPNNGYICEAAASYLDRQLQTNIVPLTDTTCLSSPTFYYSYLDRKRYMLRRRNLPCKVGSFQLFLHDYEQADSFFAKYPVPQDDTANTTFVDARGTRSFVWTEAVVDQFREELEKLVVLDYIMRNTDRGMDNWMIKLVWRSTGNQSTPFLHIGAIDSGLSWPWKHPDKWRSYPYGWLFLPLRLIGHPFSDRTRKHFIHLLASPEWWKETRKVMKQVFQRDADFKIRMWKKQWAIMKGQAFNVLETLKTPGQGPIELARRSRLMILDECMDVPTFVPMAHVRHAIDTPLGICGPTTDHKDELDSDKSTVECATTAPHAQTSGNHETGFERAVDSCARATTRVIVERIQTVKSKAPVFTWC